MRMIWQAAVAGLMLLGPAHAQADEKPGTADLAAPLSDRIDDLGGVPCDLGALTCVTIKMPRNWTVNDPDANLPITFAVNFATELSRGVLIYAVGGPGGSGLAVADDYLTAFEPELVASFDFVFFDQRGVGPVHGIACPEALAAFDEADLPLDEPDTALAAAERFVTDCVAAIADPAMLGLVDTEQVVRDLEQFRQAIGAPKVWIYGESYGTQLAQQYAAAFPDAIQGVILDGVVDLNLGLRAYYASYSRASENILARTLAACAMIADCATDMQGPAERVYDTLAAQLSKGPIAVDFPLADGGVSKREMTATLLETNAFYALYSPEQRAAFLRVLAAAGRGDMVPMMRQGYSNLYVDPETEAGLADPGWFGAAYYAITCSDYAEAETPDPQAILADAQARAAGKPRLIRSYYAERLACAFWPERGDIKRPEPFAGGDYPTLILNSDTDPITPVSMSYSVMDNVRNGYLTVMQGGPHVIWGRGLGCPDRTVSRLMLEGVLPATSQICEQRLVDDYAPLTLKEPAAAADPLTLAKGVETELQQYPEFFSWDYVDPIAVSCDHGGRMTATSDDAGVRYDFASCAMWPGLVLDGSGLQVDAGGPDDGLTLDLMVSGAFEGQIGYRHDTFEEAWEISGIYDGKEVTVPRPLP
jgi:pimeloyl-ACP methyl ester carboxylesterase